MPPSKETPSAPQTFHSFTRLPPEIRTQIWNLVPNFFPNTIQIRPLFTPRTTYSRGPPSPKALAATNWRIRSTTPPILLHINREARTHFQKLFSRPFNRSISRHSSSLVFNREIDTLFIHIYMTPNVPFDIAVIFPALFSPAGLDEMYASLRFLAGNQAFWEHMLAFVTRRGMKFQGLETAVLVLDEDEDWESGDLLVGFEEVDLDVDRNGDGVHRHGDDDSDKNVWEGKFPYGFPYPYAARRVMQSVRPRIVEMVMKEPLGEWQIVWKSDVRRMMR
ncbi:hypothetical protein IFR05_015668 [Cadophora sp. M221]|nr:hypothetical protein IFR05_015668 [Cadophora sp. M221]